MQEGRTALVEQIQRLITATIAVHPAGHGLCLIGGFRYRLLAGSCRTSSDLDYHWGGDLEQKQEQIVELLERRVVPEVRRRFGYDGHARKAVGPEADSPFVKTVELAFYRTGESPERAGVPVEITSIPCADPPVVRTVAGTVYLTVSDADAIEGKILALLCRIFVQQRDIVDIFLFQDQARADSPGRLRAKLALLGVAPEVAAEKLVALMANRAHHARAIDVIIEDQIDGATAANLKTAGGGGMIFDAVVGTVDGLLKTVDPGRQERRDERP